MSRTVVEVFEYVSVAQNTAKNQQSLLKVLCKKWKILLHKLPIFFGALSSQEDEEEGIKDDNDDYLLRGKLTKKSWQNNWQIIAERNWLN